MKLSSGRSLPLGVEHGAECREVDGSGSGWRFGGFGSGGWELAGDEDAFAKLDASDAVFDRDDAAGDGIANGVFARNSSRPVGTSCLMLRRSLRPAWSISRTFALTISPTRRTSEGWLRRRSTAISLI